jgi:hypothetical protein
MNTILTDEQIPLALCRSPGFTFEKLRAFLAQAWK